MDSNNTELKHIKVRINQGLFEESRKILEELGLPFTAAFNAYLRYIVRAGEVPYEDSAYRSGFGETHPHSFRVDPQTYEKACAILEKEHISLNHAVNRYCLEILETRSLPLELKLPNEEN